PAPGSRGGVDGADDLVYRHHLQQVVGKCLELDTRLRPLEHLAAARLVTDVGGSWPWDRQGRRQRRGGDQAGGLHRDLPAGVPGLIPVGLTGVVLGFVTRLRTSARRSSSGRARSSNTGEVPLAGVVRMNV